MTCPITIERTKIIASLAPWAQQNAAWPSTGRPILAHYDEATVVVYQAFNRDIAAHAVANQSFLGCPLYNPTRMTWVKTNFLWMMYRCGWATKDKNQTNVLAIRLKREGFDTIIRRAVETSHNVEQSDEWREALNRSDVRLQWDPDHNPDGSKCERRAIQLGLKGKTVQQFHAEWIVAIEDITESLVAPQQTAAKSRDAWPALMLPAETVYPNPLPQEKATQPAAASAEKDADNEDAAAPPAPATAPAF